MLQLQIKLPVRSRLDRLYIIVPRLSLSEFNVLFLVVVFSLLHQTEFRMASRPMAEYRWSAANLPVVPPVRVKSLENR